jgi:acetyltransferase-like isoleucine patch superfamily enzyme
VALALTPSWVKIPIYRRVFGFDIGKNVRIGHSVLDVRELKLEDGARIGHGNVLTATQRVSLGRAAEIGHFNIIRGGNAVRLDDYAWVMRFNLINSIPDNDCEDPTDPRIEIGMGACVVAGHRLDFTNSIRLGKNVIIAGRNSSLWTHNRQQSQPIDIGDYCYLGSEVRLAPGVRLSPYSIVGMGAVLTGATTQEGVLLGGVPAKVIRTLNDEDVRRLRRKTRRTIPEDAY